MLSLQNGAHGIAAELLRCSLMSGQRADVKLLLHMSHGYSEPTAVALCLSTLSL